MKIMLVLWYVWNESLNFVVNDWQMDDSRRESFLRIKHDLWRYIVGSDGIGGLLPLFQDAWRSRLMNPHREPLVMFTASCLLSIIVSFILRPDLMQYEALVAMMAHRFRIADAPDLFRRIEASFREYKISAYRKITAHMSFLLRNKRLSDVLEIYRDHLVPRHYERKNLGEVFTPFILVDMILDLIPRSIWEDPASTFFDPSAGMGGFLVRIYHRLMISLIPVIPDADMRERHIIRKMLFAAEINAVNVGWMRKIFGGHLHIYHGDTITKKDLLGYFGMPHGFRVIVGNPPFEKQQMKEGAPRNGGASLWPDFVHRSLTEWLADGGIMGMVLPPGWRKPADNKSSTAGLWDLMTRKNKINHIRMLSQKDASQMFDNHVSIRIDIVVITESKPSSRHRTAIETISGDRTRIRLAEWPFLPNANLALWERIICTTTEPRADVMYTTTYHTDSHKDRIRRTPSEGFKHPVIHSIHKDGSPVVVYTDERLQKGGFGVPKVILNGFGGWNPPILDMEGRFGLSQTVFAIRVSSHRQGSDIMRFFQDANTRRLMTTDLTWSTSKPMITWKMFRNFCKDFYRLMNDPTTPRG